MGIMAKATFEEQEEIINTARKNVNYDTKEFTLELLHSKFNRYIEDTKTKEISIPFYQRNFVWTPEDQSRFIESILLGLPIPPMFFAEAQDGVLEVIDGSQRMRTINAFLNGDLTLVKLEKLSELNGLKFNDFNSSRKRKINNVTMRAIVLFDLEKDTLDISHELFDRLNTGGRPLTTLEIIRGSKKGKFIDFIFELGEYSLLNEIGKFSKDDANRGYREEFLIKYFAFSDSLEFHTSINDFLDTYIDDMNQKFDNDSFRDEYLTNFKNMLSFLKDNSLIADISIHRKNRLLALFVGSTLALKAKPSLQAKLLYNDTFLDNAKSNGFAKLKENIELVQNILLS